MNGSSGGGSLYVTDTANVSEVTIDITGGLGESEVGGPVINVVPRTGGNIFSGNVLLRRRERLRCRAATSTTSCVARACARPAS